MKALPVELLAPGQGRDITVLVHCHIGDKMQLLAQGGTGVRIGTVIEQQAGKCRWGELRYSGSRLSRLFLGELAGVRDSLLSQRLTEFLHQLGHSLGVVFARGFLSDDPPRARRLGCRIDWHVVRLPGTLLECYPRTYNPETNI